MALIALTSYLGPLSTFSRIESCRIRGNDELAPILDLGNQFLTGVFPQTRDQAVTCGPLQLVKCHGQS